MWGVTAWKSWSSGKAEKIFRNLLTLTQRHSVYCGCRKGGQQDDDSERSEQRTGVSIRTLQYYDKIGLLRAAGRTEAGYRLYDDAALERFAADLIVPGTGISTEGHPENRGESCF